MGASFSADAIAEQGPATPARTSQWRAFGPAPCGCWVLGRVRMRDEYESLGPFTPRR
jgi:hypothetical protein